MKWWVIINWGLDHAIVQEPERPVDGDGPYDTFTEARAYVVESGVAYARRINDRTRWWRTASKAEILRSLDNDFIDW